MITCRCGMPDMQCNVRHVVIEASRHPVMHIGLDPELAARHAVPSEILLHLDANGLVELIDQARAALRAMAGDSS